jgi:hypothetical protein
LVEENFPIEAEIIEEEEALPDYTPGEKKEDIPEKIQSLEPRQNDGDQCSNRISGYVFKGRAATIHIRRRQR